MKRRLYPVVKHGARLAIAVAMIVFVAGISFYLKYTYIGGVTDYGEIVPPKKLPWIR